MLRIKPLLPMLVAGALSMAVMVGIYTGIEISGLVTGSGELLTLRVGALPVMMALPLLAIRLARLSKPTQMVLGMLIAATVMVAATFEGSHLAVLTVLLAILVGGPRRHRPRSAAERGRTRRRGPRGCLLGGHVQLLCRRDHRPECRGNGCATRLFGTGPTPGDRPRPDAVRCSPTTLRYSGRSSRLTPSIGCPVEFGTHHSAIRI